MTGTSGKGALNVNIRQNLAITTLAVALTGTSGSTADSDSHVSALATQIRSDVQASILKTQQAKDPLALEMSGSSPSQIFENIEAFRNPEAWTGLCSVLSALNPKDLAHFDRSIHAPQYEKQLKCASTLSARLNDYWQQSKILLMAHRAQQNLAFNKPSRDPAATLAPSTMASVEIPIRMSEYAAVWGNVSEGLVHEKQIAFVFEDGGQSPAADRVTQLLDLLKTTHTRATFFQTGQAVRQNPMLNRQIAGAGHTVASHSMTHAALSRVGLQDAFKEIDRGREEITACTGQDIPFIRLPFDASNENLDQHLREKKMTVFHDNISSRDWQLTDATELFDQVMKELSREKGGIVVLHESNAASLIVLPYLLEELRTQGFSTVVFVPSPT